MHKRWLQLVPDFRPLRAYLYCLQSRLPLPHELAEKLPQQLLQRLAQLRHVWHVHVRYRKCSRRTQPRVKA
jgi:hypothetical protein